MRVLVMSISPWRGDNSVGNTLSNIFGGMEEKIEFGNIYLKSGKPDNTVCKRYFQITEKSLLKGILKHKTSGAEIKAEKNADVLTQDEQRTFDFARKKRWTILFLIRELIWKIGVWKTAELDKFLEDFNPDVIFLLLNETIYSNKLADYVCQKLNKPMVIYTWDDVYGLNRKFKGLMSRCYRSRMRYSMHRVIKNSNWLYVISDVQKKQYGEQFKKNCKILTKGSTFNAMPTYSLNTRGVIKIIYTGNIGENRWVTLSMLAEEISRINENKTIFELDIYTFTPLSEEIKSALNSKKGVNLKGGVDSSTVKSLQQNADILLHVEAFDDEHKGAVMCSFSTKLVDYFAAGKCVMAVGPEEVASIDYLIKNDAALVMSNSQQIQDVLNRIIIDRNIMAEYGKKAWECGRKNHDIYKIQSDLYNDLKGLANENCAD